MAQKPLTDAQVKMLEGLVEPPNTSETPEVPSQNWDSAERGKYVRTPP